MNQFRPAALFTILVLIVVIPHSMAQEVYTTFDYPGWETQLIAVSGNNIIGQISSSNVDFLYNGSTFTDIQDPFATGVTYAYGISGNSIVGSYNRSGVFHGFIYDGSSYTTFNHPLGTNGTSLDAIDGNNLVGGYADSSNNTHSFLYSNGTYTTLNDPLAVVGGTLPCGISGNNIAGNYYADVYHTTLQGFLYNISTDTYITLADPLGTGGTVVTGVSGNNVVGYYYSSTGAHGFFYDGSTYFTLDDPLATNGTYATGISGNTIIGNYYSTSQSVHGFILTLPEPSSWPLVLLGLGMLAVIKIQFSKRTHRETLSLL